MYLLFADSKRTNLRNGKTHTFSLIYKNLFFSSCDEFFLSKLLQQVYIALLWRTRHHIKFTSQNASAVTQHERNKFPFTISRIFIGRFFAKLFRKFRLKSGRVDMYTVIDFYPFDKVLNGLCVWSVVSI